MFLAQKFFKDPPDDSDMHLDDFILFFNSAFFYSIGYWVLNENTTGVHFLGTFTLLNALIHLVISKFVYERNLNDKTWSSLKFPPLDQKAKPKPFGFGTLMRRCQRKLLIEGFNLLLIAQFAMSNRLKLA